ncbi:MAG: DegV family protein [Mycoplasmatales bacterium]
MQPLGIIITGSVPYSQKMLESKIIHQDIQFSINFEDEQYLNSSLTQKRLFELISEKREIPKTSQPSFLEITEALKKRLQEYEQLIFIVPNRELSGTYQGVISAVKELNKEEEKVFIIESSCIALAEIDIVERIIELKDQLKASEIAKELAIVNNVTYAFPTDEKFLKLSGRVSGSQALLIGLLKIRPIVCMEPYKKPYFPYKGRGLKSVLKYIEIHIFQDIEQVEKIFFTKIALSSLEEKELIKLFKKKKINYEVVQDAPPVVATHFGPNSFGIYLKKTKN